MSRAKKPADPAAQTLPLLPLRDVVVYPGMVIPLFVGRDKSIRAVGAAMARATSIELAANGTLRVSAESDHWRRETRRSAAVVRRRLARLLGPDAVRRIVVDGKG